MVTVPASLVIGGDADMRQPPKISPTPNYCDSPLSTMEPIVVEPQHKAPIAIESQSKNQSPRSTTCIGGNPHKKTRRSTIGGGSHKKIKKNLGLSPEELESAVWFVCLP